MWMRCNSFDPALVDIIVKTLYSRAPDCTSTLVKSHRIADRTRPSGAVAACAFVQAMRLGGNEQGSTHPGGWDA